MELVHDLSFLEKEEVDFVVFDLETTGLNNRKDRIVEIGAIKYSNGQIVEHLNYLINPEIPIPSIASSIHGIYDNDVADKPLIEDILPEFLKMIEGTVLVAHNASFDVGFIKKAMGRAELSIPDMRVLDTIKLSKKVWPGRKSYSQPNLAIFLSINVLNAHRAEDDCRVCLQILKLGLEKIKTGGMI
ncbi:MAG: 3'-5' exonuclease [Spirochaetaceae bacterium]|jgi:DNA polymerase III epsilon subunit family exonuclease|nr:3'-5' exonuclease [Spirochaetaceae bacterium]